MESARNGSLVRGENHASRHPTITVDFYLYSSHEVAVWEPIWRTLRTRGVDAQFVLEPPGIHRAMGSVPDPKNAWLDDKDGDVVPLMDDETHSSLVALLANQNLPAIDHSRLSADAVITTQGIGWLLQYHESLRIKTEYGASAFVGVHGHGAINTGLDAVLAHGAFSKSAISAHLERERIHRVGYPKWAPTLRGRLSRQTAREMLGIETHLPVVAWLPTWAHNSGIDVYSAALANLANEHLVVAKPHHNSVRFEAKRLAEIDNRIDVREDLHTLVPLLLAADVVVADGRSGALAETFLADRPVVGLLPGIDAQEHGVMAGLNEAVTWCEQPEDLALAVQSALEVDRSEARSVWRRWLFDDMGGHDDEAAAEVIIDLISRKAGHSVTSLPLANLDRLIESTDTRTPESFMHAFTYAWARWPQHPRLLAMLADAALTLAPSDLLTCGRLVRNSGLLSSCPLIAVMHDDRADPVTRVMASALAAIEFEDDRASNSFQSLVQQLPADSFDDAIYQLDLVPSSIPVFIQAAATTRDRCIHLADVLDLLGAQDEAATLQAYGASMAQS